MAMVFLASYIFYKNEEGFRRGRRHHFPHRRFPRKPWGRFWNTYPVYYQHPMIEAPYCDDVLCGNNIIGWDCCADMKCKKGQHKCCSGTGRCRCCKN